MDEQVIINDYSNNHQENWIVITFRLMDFMTNKDMCFFRKNYPV